MNRSMRDIVHCFECLGDFIKAWRFPFHQLVDGTFDFSQTDWFVNQCQTWLLLEGVQDSEVYCQSMSPHSSDDFALYFMEVRLRSKAQWSLSRPSIVVHQLHTRLCSVVEHTMRSSMWLSVIPELVDLLLVHVLCPGLPDFGSKKVFMMHRRCARYMCSRLLPFRFHWRSPWGPSVVQNSLECIPSSFPMLELMLAPMMISDFTGARWSRVSSVSRKQRLSASLPVLVHGW